MEELVYNQLKIFKDLTMRIIDAVNFEDTEMVLDLIDERQIVLNELDGCDKDILIKCAKDLDIIKMDSLLEYLMKNKISDIYDEIKNISKERKTVQAYNNNNSSNYSAFVYEV